jgi:hypothetical protein
MMTIHAGLMLRACYASTDRTASSVSSMSLELMP